MGNLLKHIQHPHNFDLRSVPELVISQTNISQYPAVMLCLLLLLVWGTGDYPWGISPLWALGWNPLRQYLAPGLFDIMVGWTTVSYRSLSPCLAHFHSLWETLYNTSERHPSVQHQFNLWINLSLFSLGNFTHLIKTHLKCQWFHWFPLAQFTSLEWGHLHVGQDIWTFRLFNTLQCLVRSLWPHALVLHFSVPFLT